MESVVEQHQKALRASEDNRRLTLLDLVSDEESTNTPKSYTEKGGPSGDGLSYRENLEFGEFSCREGLMGTKIYIFRRCLWGLSQELYATHHETKRELQILSGFLYPYPEW